MENIEDAAELREELDFEQRTDALLQLMEDAPVIKRTRHSLLIEGARDSDFTEINEDLAGLRRSASISILNSSGVKNLDEDEYNFFAKLKSSSKELRNVMWSKRERRQKRDARDELMKCHKLKKAAITSAKEAIESVRNELGKTTSLTTLRGRLQEARTNNRELKQSIFHKMSDRSLVRLSVQPDLPRLLWQIVSLQSQVTVLRQRVSHMSEKYQNMSPVPVTNQNDKRPLSRQEESASTVVSVEKSESTSHKPRSGWKAVMAKFFRTKKMKE